MSATAERQIPFQRMVGIITVARATRSMPVLVVCANRTVERQYVRGVKSAGGKVSNLHFLRANGMADRGDRG